jgi:spore coat polysaccharide biosynthesis protein SpsF
MLALARALRDRENMTVGFSLAEQDDFSPAVRSAGFEVHMNGAAEFAARVKLHRPDLLILDGGGLSRAQTEALRRDVILTAAIEDGSDSRLACDFAYYSPLPQARVLGWAGARTVPRIGWEWSLMALDPRLAPARAPGARPTLLVAMGDSDPAGLTERAARLLALLETTFRIRFVIGRGMQNAGRTAAAIVRMRSSYETVEGADDLSTEYAAADLALCAFGNTAYELAAFGVPALYLGLTDADARSASAFAIAGMGENLGVADRITNLEILEAVKTLMNDSARRRDIRGCALAALDGGGAARIAGDLAKALKEETAPLRARR